MEGELKNYIKVWLQAIISLSYCYFLGKFVPKGIPRLFAILPIVCLFVTLPLNLQSVHLGGTLGFFISWLANFKLLLFAFGRGPLSDPSLTLHRFVAVASFPIKIQENPHANSLEISQTKINPSSNSYTNGQIRQNPSKKANSEEKPSPKLLSNNHQVRNKAPKSLLNYATKCLIFAAVLKIYDYTDHIHPKVILFIYCVHVYLCLEIILAIVAGMARALLRIDLEPQFDEPYLSSSLQDFWGRRWNIIVTRILRPTVYEPTHSIAARFMDRKWAILPAVSATFLVSGLMHELIIFYLGRLKPTWEITWFFVLHGFCLLAEILVKRQLIGKFRLPRLISSLLTVGFVMVTSFWLFFPQLLRCKGDERALQEYAAVGAFVKNVSRFLTKKSLGSSDSV